MIRPLLIAALLSAVGPAALAQNPTLDALRDRLGRQGGQNQEAPSPPGNSGTAGNGTGNGSGMAAAGAALASGMGLSMPSIGRNSMGNAAGVLQYCIRNNYLSSSAATGLKDRLMGMVGGNKSQQSGYQNGSKGLLQGTDGKSLDLKGIGSKLKTKACDYVLTHAQSLV